MTDPPPPLPPPPDRIGSFGDEPRTTAEPGRAPAPPGPSARARGCGLWLLAVLLALLVAALVWYFL